MKINCKFIRPFKAGLSLCLLLVGLGANSPLSADTLYIGDGGDDSVKRFDARTGKYLGDFVTPGSAGLNGPRGMIFSQGRLLLANQNVDQDFAGEILSFRRDTGAFLNALIPCNPPLNRVCNPNAPFAPRGILRGSGRTLYVADHDGAKVAKYDRDGVFLGKLDSTGFSGVLGIPGLIFPRGIVRGPDDLLYVSVTALPTAPPGDSEAGKVGYILRFNPVTGKFVDVFASNLGPGCAVHLHRPEGLVFGPNDKLYVTAFRVDANDTDKILVFNRKGQCLGQEQIDLDAVGQPRSFAQALLFGPNNRLFVPINNTGEVRRYNVRTKTFDIFVPAGGSLVNPWYLTFGDTDPSTLEYDD